MVIAQRLVAGLEHRPAIVLVNDGVLLADADPPLGHLAGSGVDPIGAAGAVEPFAGARSAASWCSSAPARRRCASSPRRRRTSIRSSAAALFAAAETMDLHEPMSRVRAGLGLIAQGDVAAA